MARQKGDLHDFWERVDAEIYSQGRNKKEVAEKCGFDRKNLINKGNLSVSFLILLSKELNVSADWLLFGNDWETED